MEEHSTRPQSEGLSAPRCDACGVENVAGTKFCGGCGAKFVARPDPVLVGEEPGLYYCSKHKKETTRVTCGRCERPICHKCLVMSPAGIRCKGCSTFKVQVRPMGVAHDLTGGIARLFSRIRGTPIYYWIILLIGLKLLASIFGR